MNHRTRRLLVGGSAITAAAVVCAALAIAGPVPAPAVITDTSALRNAVTVKAILRHLRAFQDIADANGGTRAAGTTGHRASVAYIDDLLRDAGYTTWRQPFDYERTDFGDSTVQQLTPTATAYALGVDYLPMEFSGAGDVSGPVTPVDLNLTGDHASTSGCEAADFAGFPAGTIALIQRGSCSFATKADHAVAAGATGVIVLNQGGAAPGADRQGVFGGTLGEPVRTIPVVSVSHDLGASLAATTGLTMRLKLEARLVRVHTENLLADTPTGRADRTVVVGGHLDSVPEGPGISDNGTGTASILETALQLAALGVEPENRVRFAFWSGEEDGLIGSRFYVSQLSAQDVADTALNLNFDMVGSPNAVNFVYDGDGSALGESGPTGSGTIERVLTDFFGSQGEPTQPTEFDGRSDYFGFIRAGIPAGGLFAGAEGIKSAAQAEIFGGTAGQPYDPCYHSACDTIDNLGEATLDLMADAIAHATMVFAETTSAVHVRAAVARP